MRIHTRTSVRVAFVAVCSILFGTFASADATRPMKGNFSSTGLTFTGNYAHMGLITGQITSVTFISPTAAIVTSTATAADGDELHATSVLTITGANPGSGNLTFVQVLDFTGGTGRFAGATGQVTANGEVSPDFASGFGAFEGWIRY